MAYPMLPFTYPVNAPSAPTHAYMELPLASPMRSSPINTGFDSDRVAQWTNFPRSASRLVYENPLTRELHSHDGHLGAELTGPDTRSQTPAVVGTAQSRRHELVATASLPLECRWEGCTYAGQFNRVGDLLRHIRQIHLTPGQYRCPLDEHCKPFNRRDNLRSHLRRVHGHPV